MIWKRTLPCVLAAVSFGSLGAGSLSLYAVLAPLGIWDETTLGLLLGLGFMAMPLWLLFSGLLVFTVPADCQAFFTPLNPKDRSVL